MNINFLNSLLFIQMNHIIFCADSECNRVWMIVFCTIENNPFDMSHDNLLNKDKRRPKRNKWFVKLDLIFLCSSFINLNIGKIFEKQWDFCESYHTKSAQRISWHFANKDKKQRKCIWNFLFYLNIGSFAKEIDKTNRLTPVRVYFYEIHHFDLTA